MKTSVKSNLFLGIGLSLAILIVISFASYYSIKNLIKSSELVGKSNQVINLIHEVENSLKDAETAQRGFLLTGNELFLQPYKNVKGKITPLFEEIRLITVNNPIQQKNLLQLENDVTERMRLLEKNLSLRQQNQEVTATDLLEGKHFMDDSRKVITDMRIEEERLLKLQTASLNTLSRFTPGIIIFSALLAIVITLFFYKKVLSDFNEKAILQKKLEKKNEEIQNRITAIEKVAAGVSEGNYDLRLDADTKDSLGSLSISLNKMTNSLSGSFTLLKQKEWFQSGVALLNNEMVGDKSTEDLADDIMSSVASFTKSSTGALYIMEKDRRFHLTGSYALDPSLVPTVINRKEGIAGQCLQSEKCIILNDIPDNSATISFASGRTKPVSILAIPIFFHKRVVGVMEFASLQNYNQQEIDFLIHVSENIGIGLTAAENQKRLKELLEETQSQAEELQAQQSELENINAELEAQTQKLQASEEELRVQQEELMQSNQELEERTGLLEEKNTLIEERNQEIEKKSRELELSSKYKSEFLANMSHELRTPLNSILLLSKLMADSMDLTREYVEYAEVIQSSGNGLLSLIDEILDLSKIEAGKMELEMADASINEIVSDMKSMFQPVAKSKGLDLIINLAEDLPVMLYSDKMRLEQILKNLLSNAIKFTSEGEITLGVAYEALSEKVLFSVRDTGIGIPSEKQKLIFEAFQQADGSTRRRFGGTGLGLSISRELSKLLNGEILLSSEEKEGSEFILKIPVDSRKLEKPAQAEEIRVPEIVSTTVVPELRKRYIVDQVPGEISDDRNAIGEADKVILIVEDDTSFAKILLDYTRAKNYKGLVALRGDEAVELALKYIPRAILLDIQLPIMDGWQVIEALKTDSKTRHIPVHMMSSLKMKRESLLKGAVDFIDKPFALEQLQEVFYKLENALSKHPKKVLIVEENNQHAKALSYFLGVNNISSLISSNIDESIRALQSHEIDCVILDMGIPHEMAYETLETIKENKGLENLPIIIFTGKSLSLGEQNKIKKYADSIVVKTAHSYQRILDEAGLFLHLVEEKNNNPIGTAGIGNTVLLRNVLGQRTVLIADDDVRNIFSLTKALEMQKMKVFPAMDGKEALKILNETENIDVILMDMMMPHMDGYETIKKIRTYEKYKKVPILAVTAKAMKGDREKCIEAGASDYISKPVDIDQLISLLRVWLYDKI